MGAITDDWGYRNCTNCRLVRVAMRQVAVSVDREKAMSVDLAIALLDVSRLKEELKNYTRGITDMEELDDVN